MRRAGQRKTFGGVLIKGRLSVIVPCGYDGCSLKTVSIQLLCLCLDAEKRHQAIE